MAVLPFLKLCSCVLKMMKTVYAAKRWRSMRSASKLSKMIMLLWCVALVVLLKYTVKYLSSSVEGAFRSLRDYNGAWQSDPEFISYMRHKLILPPDWKSSEIDEDTVDFSEHGQSKILANILQNAGGGFFLEARAGDGEKGSLSLYFERELEWSGLLVEDDFDTFVQLTYKNRASFTIHAKLSPSESVKMTQARWNNFTGEEDPVASSWEIPLYSLFLAMGPPRIDLLILDTTGSELEILKTIPWESIKVNVMCIAYDHLPGNPNSLTTFLKRQGFRLMETHVKDMFFASEEYLKEVEEEQA